MVAHALDWLSKHQERPFFMWVHLFDPHTPYDPPEPYKTRYKKALYDGEIAYVDSAMGKFFRQLKASGLYDDTMVVLTADHGESLGAHGENEHGIFVYDETIHVPLVIKLPHGAVAGKRIEDRVELADIVPTVLGSLGIPVPEKVQGQSMLGLLEPGTVGRGCSRQGLAGSRRLLAGGLQPHLLRLERNCNRCGRASICLFRRPAGNCMKMRWTPTTNTILPPHLPPSPTHSRPS